MSVLAKSANVDGCNVSWLHQVLTPYAAVSFEMRRSRWDRKESDYSPRLIDCNTFKSFTVKLFSPYMCCSHLDTNLLQHRKQFNL